MSPLPTLYIAPLPGGAWLVDTSESLVAAQAGGAPVTRVDVGALVRVAGDVVDAYAALERPTPGALARAIGGLAAALGDSALLGKGE